MNVSSTKSSLVDFFQWEFFIEALPSSWSVKASVIKLTFEFCSNIQSLGYQVYSWTSSVVWVKAEGQMRGRQVPMMTAPVRESGTVGSFWRNKHSRSRCILLWSKAGNQQGESSEFLFFLTFGIKKRIYLYFSLLQRASSRWVPTYILISLFSLTAYGRENVPKVTWHPWIWGTIPTCPRLELPQISIYWIKGNWCCSCDSGCMQTNAVPPLTTAVTSATSSNSQSCTGCHNNATEHHIWR